MGDKAGDEGREAALRQALGIPSHARRVIVFGETSHWDPNWLFTSEEYFRMRVGRVIDLALAALEAEPRRVFGIESVFFLKRYWDQHPERRAAITALINAGRLRLLGAGMTTPDTLLPEPEAILRDYLLGQEWLRENGMTAEPALAYLPDDFGHSPELPGLLRELGISQAGISRIDGMYFVGADFRRRGEFPLPGSSAALLLHRHRSLDFVWEASDGSELLTHWNAFTYFQGDMLAHRGVIRWMGITLGIPWRTAAHVTRRIDGFVQELGPLSRTPYLFCPIGCDFNDPISDLVALLDRYNRERSAATGIFAISAGLDDYLRLVDCHRASLPRLRLDPNPYWMGFYASRPEIKQRCRRTARKLLCAESLPDPTGLKECRELQEAWELVALSNHHDFITGTAPDRVFALEQRAWISRAEKLADVAMAARQTPSAPVSSGPPAFRLHRGRLEVKTRHFALALDERAGGAIVSFRDAFGRELLSEPANDLVSFRDSGGLWRLGHEFLGGVFRVRDRASEHRAVIEARERGGRLEIQIRSKLEFQPMLRRLWIEEDSPVILMRLSGQAPARRSVTVRFGTALRAGSLAMDVPGGVVHRPHKKLYDPTFWPASSFAHLHDPVGPGLAVVLAGPASLASDGRGRLDWMALRDAPRELAFGFLPVPAHPASGRDRTERDFDYAVWATPKGDWQQNNLVERSREIQSRFAGFGAIACHSPIVLSRKDAIVSAFKPADRGEGFVARLTRLGPIGPVVLSAIGPPIRAASLVDAREREREPLPVHAGQVKLELRYNLTSVRLIF